MTIFILELRLGVSNIRNWALDNQLLPRASIIYIYV